MPTKKTSAHESANRERSYKRRLKAAGIDDDTMPDDIDEFRFQLARCISMFLNQWHGCPELICQRNRGCMAPNNICTNVPQRSSEEIDREWRLVQAEIIQAVEAHLAAHGVVDD